MTKMLNPGKYRHQITIKAPATDASRDETGRRTGNVQTVATVWAEKQDWTGDESTEGRRDTATVITRFRIRYRTDIEPSMTVHYENDVYDIASVMDFDGTRRELTLNCRKVVES